MRAIVGDDAIYLECGVPVHVRIECVDEVAGSADHPLQAVACGHAVFPNALQLFLVNVVPIFAASRAVRGEVGCSTLAPMPIVVLLPAIPEGWIQISIIIWPPSGPARALVTVAAGGLGLFGILPVRHTE